MTVYLVDGVSSDDGLVARIRAGEETAVGELYDRESAALFSLAHYILRDHADPISEAEHVLVDAFSTLCRHIRGQTDAPASIRSWLLGRVRSTALARRPSRAGRLQPPDAACDDRLLTGPGFELLSLLQRRAIASIFFDGLSVEHVSDRLGESPETVRRVVADGIHALRGSLAGALDMRELNSGTGATPTRGHGGGQ